MATSNEHSGQASPSLWILRPGGETPPVSASVPFAAWYWLIAPDGSAVYAMGANPDPTERAYLALDPTLLVAFDPATGAEQWRMELAGVKFGQRRGTDAKGAPEYWQYFPQLLLASDGRRAYLWFTRMSRYWT
jgi:hypothetical protein